MFDRIDAGGDGAAHPFVAGGVRRHRTAERMGGVDRGLQFVFREGRNRCPARPRAVIGIELDPIGAVTGLMAHRAHDLVDAACFLGALRQAAIGAEVGARRTVGTGRYDGARRDEQTRPGNQPFRRWRA